MRAESKTLDHLSETTNIHQGSDFQLRGETMKTVAETSERVYRRARPDEDTAENTSNHGTMRADSKISKRVNRRARPSRARPTRAGQNEDNHELFGEVRVRNLPRRARARIAPIVLPRHLHQFY
ncbi:unnamed protein product [Arabis nemorensis]|uniref:Uncharacterized protein n=1 Tax=Arabis nemorensis TaxID=586526 RepID=A0A565BC12_9BRAS|nr:unnamed protein product [Arabis nemorensis]